MWNLTKQFENEVQKKTKEPSDNTQLSHTGNFMYDWGWGAPTNLVKNYNLLTIANLCRRRWKQERTWMADQIIFPNKIRFSQSSLQSLSVSPSLSTTLKGGATDQATPALLLQDMEEQLPYSLNMESLAS